MNDIATHPIEQLRADIDKLIALIRSIPRDQRTIAMQQLLVNLIRAVKEYDADTK